MQNTQTNTTLDPNLHLVDFSKVTPEQLKQQVTQALDKGNAYLDNLDQQDVPTEAQPALNDIIEFDHIGLDLDRSWGVLSHLNSVMSNEDIRQVHHDILPLLSAFGTRVGQNKALYSRYQTIKNDSDFFNSLDNARKRAIELAIQSFELSGVALPADKQATYADIQSQLSTLSAKFSDNILDATQAFALPLNDEQLAGITDSGLAMLQAAGEQHKAKLVASEQQTQTEVDALPTPYYVATLDIPVYLAVMTHADDRKLRETLYKAYVTRASELDSHKNSQGDSLDNSDIMANILDLRNQKAHLLGFNNYAEVSLSRKMADSAEQVESFLRNLADKATPAAKRDLAQLEAEATNQGIDEIKPWDTAYLAEKVKQDKFKLSQEEIRPYFPLPKVIDGLFDIVQQLFGVRAVEATEQADLWHEDVHFYQLFDSNADGEEQLIGGFYFDLYARQGKRGGAWMSGFQARYEYAGSSAEAYRQLPVCFMVGNFTPATNGKPSLLTHNEVLTLFHEFGHGLHHLLTKVSVSDVAGVNGVEWDAVELPSQFLENWAWDSKGINLISAHVDSGEPLPQSQLDALLAAKNFQSGMQTLRQIEFALFDLLIHADSPAPDYAGILATLDQVRHDVAVMQTPEYNRFANGFSHIFAGGYAAGYYSYKWAELLSADAFSRFEEEGVFNAQTGQDFRNNILAVGGSLPAKTNFEAFRGREASIDALLRHGGFVDSDEVA
ncbi:M3 family metallopeptidase [Psychrobacter sp. FDAARGOS_221]|uniref:M3 family metallopeptidase n=1 Tax=Psychrobacter sp. FDAARGOS_221 TaxID=1975705 RepID=UPI000BB593CF|nr:M3 family metallopeptidase [Psychrobacter sp. FDAARGOS_221]PNK60895.1 M3 family peptidase [Psychrobacter sp. FDAARGOS_221]